jgi:signal peptidase II
MLKILMNLKLPQILGLSLIIDIIIIDQLTKWAITEYVLRPLTNEGESLGLIAWLMDAPEKLGQASIAIMPYFNLTMVWNHGVSFGMLQGAGIWPLTVIAIVICGFLGHWLLKTNSKTEAVALSLIIGGAIGNVIDRLRFGAVADFFDFYIGDWHYPAFNIADSAIAIGVVVLLIYGLFLNKEGENK